MQDRVRYVEGYKPLGDKVSRMTIQAAQIENSFVYIPAEPHWLEDYLHELAVFPTGNLDDQVNSTSQALEAINFNRVKSWGYLEMARIANRATAERRGIVDTKKYDAPGSMQWQAQQDGRGALASLSACASTPRSLWQHR